MRAADYLLALAACKKTILANQHPTMLTFSHVLFAAGFPADETRRRAERADHSAAGRAPVKRTRQTVLPAAAGANKLAIFAGEVAFNTTAKLLLGTVDKAVAASFNGKSFGDPFGGFPCIGLSLFK